MKKLIFILFTALLTGLSAAAFAEGWDFENGPGGLLTVTNSLDAGGSAVFDEGFEGQGLKLDGSYGLRLGRVEGGFTAMAMVKVTSGGDNRTLFFKNMGTLENENWTGVIFNGGVPTFWAREGWRKRPTTAKSVMNAWTFLAYAEEDGTGRLYIDGELASEGDAVSEPGDIYLGATYWSADALSGYVDNVELLDRALTQEEITEIYKSRVVPVRFADYEFPSELIVSDLDLGLVPGGEDVKWISGNEALLSSNGTLTRPVKDTNVTLTGTYRGATREFKFTALGSGGGTNGNTILSYKPTESDGAILTDLSGNGNHGVIHGDLTGGNFDGGDWVDLPKGIFSGHDRFTLVLRLTPWANTSDQAVFSIGNSADEYFFLNTSTPRTNLLRAAITDSGAEGEKDLITAPGIKSMRFSSIVITAEGTLYKMYVDGLLTAEDDLGLSPSGFGSAVKSFLGRSAEGQFFRGTIDEFTIYSSVMSDDEIYGKFSKATEAAATRYISNAEINTDSFSLLLSLSRDCMLAANFYDAHGNLTGCVVRKVSGDSLKAELSVDGSSSVEIYAFDPATGELGQRLCAAQSGDLYAVFEWDGDSITAVNTGSADAEAALTLLTYEGEELKAADIYDINIGAGLTRQLPLTAGPGVRILINEKR